MLEANGELAHIHLLLELPPTAALSEFVNALKTGTSRRLRNEFKEQNDLALPASSTEVMPPSSSATAMTSMISVAVCSRMALNFSGRRISIFSHYAWRDTTMSSQDANGSAMCGLAHMRARKVKQRPMLSAAACHR